MGTFGVLLLTELDRHMNTHRQKNINTPNLLNQLSRLNVVRVQGGNVSGAVTSAQIARGSKFNTLNDVKRKRHMMIFDANARRTAVMAVRIRGRMQPSPLVMFSLLTTWIWYPFPFDGIHTWNNKRL